MSEFHAQLIVANSLEDAEIPEAYRVSAADVFHLNTDNLSIGDARHLVEVASTRPVAGNSKVIVLVFKKATVEAQNALLKLFEEPPTGVLFYVVVPHLSLLLPTLRSRLIAMNTSVQKVELSEDTKAFIKASLAERLAVIADKQKSKDSEWMSTMIHELAIWAARTPKNMSSEALVSIETAERYVNIRGASRKSLLENVALSI